MKTNVDQSDENCKTVLKVIVPVTHFPRQSNFSLSPAKRVSG